MKRNQIEKATAKALRNLHPAASWWTMTACAYVLDEYAGGGRGGACAEDDCTSFAFSSSSRETAFGEENEPFSGDFGEPSGIIIVQRKELESKLPE